MKSGKRKKWILNCILILTVIISFIIYRNVLLYKIKREKYLDNIIEVLHKNFNLKINKDEYNSKIVRQSTILMPYYYYILEHKTKTIEETKSKYLYSEKYGCSYDSIINKNTSFFSKEGTLELFRLIRNYGFGQYFLNEFIYDKTKGNDFEKIEEVFSEFEKKHRLSYDSVPDRCLGFIDTRKHTSRSILNTDVSSKDYYEVLQVQKRFISYFSVERNFEDIDWYDFKKKLKIKPVLLFFTDANKEELTKLLEQIKPYYNRDEYIIAFSGNKGEDVW